MPHIYEDGYSGHGQTIARTDVSTIAHGPAELINQRDQTGATAVHYAAFGGHRRVVQALVEQARKSMRETVNSVDACRVGDRVPA